MPLKLTNIRHTLSARLSRWVIVTSTLLFVAVMWVMLLFARKAVKEEATEKAQATLGTAVLTIDNELGRVETAARTMLPTIEAHLDDAKAMMALSRQMLENNPSIEGATIAMHPNHYPSKDSLFMAYYYRVGDSIVCSDHFGNTPYDKQEWFIYPILDDSASWIDPLLLGKYSPRPIITYSAPIHGRDGRPEGVLAFDISLEWLSQTIQAARPFPNTYCALMNRNGSFIIHPDTTMLKPGSVKYMYHGGPDSDGARLADAMLKGETGSMAVDILGIDCYVFYQPFMNTGWSINIVCPESEIFASYNQLVHIVTFITIAGLLALLVYCLLFIGEQLKPLYILDASAKRLANGQFGTSLKDSTRKDEIGDMQRAFKDMQQSLNSHLEEITLQRESLEKRGESLRAAYEKTKEADKTKAAFILSATEQISQPAATIYDIVGKICEEHAHLGHEEIVQMTEEMNRQTDTITNLLDRMLVISSIHNLEKE